MVSQKPCHSTGPEYLGYIDLGIKKVLPGMKFSVSEVPLLSLVGIGETFLHKLNMEPPVQKYSFPAYVPAYDPGIMPSELNRSSSLLTLSEFSIGFLSIFVSANPQSSIYGN
jgi:hypothetical protein